MSFFDAAVNRNKRNVAVDLSQPAGREVLLALAKDVDVLVENFVPGGWPIWGAATSTCGA